MRYVVIVITYVVLLTYYYCYLIVFAHSTFKLFLYLFNTNLWLSLLDKTSVIQFITLMHNNHFKQIKVDFFCIIVLRNLYQQLIYEYFYYLNALL